MMAGLKISYNVTLMLRKKYNLVYMYMILKQRVEYSKEPEDIFRFRCLSKP